MTDPTRYDFEFPDEAGYPDGKGFLSQDQKVLIDEIEDPHALAMRITIVKDTTSGSYDAISGDRELGALTYDLVGDDRIILLATSVFPEFRNQGVATAIIRQVLDDIRAEGKTISVMCPIVRTFIDRNPEYDSLVDAAHPGVTQRSH